MQRRMFLNLAAAAVATTKIPAVALADGGGASSSSVRPSLQLAETIASNLAFAAPPPWGPVAAAGIAGIFGGLFMATSSGPSELSVIADLIQNAVKDIEDHETALFRGAEENKATTFFAWVRDNMDSDASEGLGPTVWNDNLKNHALDLVKQLDKSGSFYPDTLYAGIHHVGDEQLLQQNQPGIPKSDPGLNVLLSLASALISATKLRMSFHASIASYLAPDPNTGRCRSNQEDSAFQYHANEVHNAFNDLHTYVYGIKGYDVYGYFEKYSAPQYSDIGGVDLSEAENGPGADYRFFHRARWETDWGATRSVIGTIEDARNAVLLKAKQNVDAPLKNGHGWQDENVGPDYRRMLADTLLGPQSMSAAEYAVQHGWAAAIDRAFAHKVAARLCQMEMFIIPVISFRYMDHYSGDAENIYYSHEPYNYFLHKVDAVLAECLEYTPPPPGPETFGTINAGFTQVTAGWRSGVEQTAKHMPPNEPPNAATIADKDWTRGAPPQGSFWARSRSVSYAFSVVHPQTGPSPRSNWITYSTRMSGAPRWCPHIRHVPIQSGCNVQVWRRFAFRNEVDQDVYSTPEVVAILDPGLTTYFDQDQAPND